MAKKLKLAVITDIHYGVDVGAKLGSKAPKMMDQFAKIVNKYSPDALIDMGDRVSANNANENDDRHYMKALKTKFNKVAAPLYSVIGNHDVHKLTREENKEIMGSPAESYSIDQNGYHLIFWNPHLSKGLSGLHVRPEDIDWLGEDLEKTDKPTIVFSHVPLTPARKNSKKNISIYYQLSDTPQIMKILENSGKVLFCMAGHRHRHKHQIVNNIHYIDQQSFTHEWKKKYRVPGRAHTFVEIDDDKIKIHRRGKIQKSFEWDRNIA